MTEAIHEGDKSIWELSIFSIQFYCEPKTALKKIKSTFKKLEQHSVLRYSHVNIVNFHNNHISRSHSFPIL